MGVKIYFPSDLHFEDWGDGGVICVSEGANIAVIAGHLHFMSNALEVIDKPVLIFKS